MALTVQGLETEVIGRISGRMAYVGFSIVANGSNPALAGPIRRAARVVGIEPANPLAVADADLATLSGWAVEQLADNATLQALKSVLGQCTQVNTMVGTDQYDLTDFMRELRAQIDDLEAVVMKPYGPALPVASSGDMTRHHHVQGGSAALNDIHRFRRENLITGWDVF